MSGIRDILVTIFHGKEPFMKKIYTKLTALLLALMLFVLPLLGCEELLPLDDPSSATSSTAFATTASETTADSGTTAQKTNKTKTKKKDDLSDKIAAAGLNPDVAKGESYTSKEDVGGYIARFHKLPDNFISKKKAKKSGWTGGSLEDYYPGCCIGGDYFGNYEGILPENAEYTECDIDTMGKKSRGAKRIIYSDDGKIYYTDDHYESFTLIYSE